MKIIASSFLFAFCFLIFFQQQVECSILSRWNIFKSPVKDDKNPCEKPNPCPQKASSFPKTTTSFAVCQEETVTETQTLITLPVSPCTVKITNPAPCWLTVTSTPPAITQTQTCTLTAYPSALLRTSTIVAYLTVTPCPF